MHFIWVVPTHRAVGMGTVLIAQVGCGSDGRYHVHRRHGTPDKMSSIMHSVLCLVSDRVVVGRSARRAVDGPVRPQGHSVQVRVVVYPDCTVRVPYPRENRVGAGCRSWASGDGNAKVVQGENRRAGDGGVGIRAGSGGAARGSAVRRRAGEGGRGSEARGKGGQAGRAMAGGGWRGK